MIRAGATPGPGILGGMRTWWLALLLAGCSYHAPDGATPTGDANGDAPGTDAPPIDAAEAWLDPWAHRKAITIHASLVDAPNGSDALADFPVLVQLADPEISNGVLAGGRDLAFTDSDGTTRLAVDTERFGDAIVAWVKVPVLSASTDTRIYAYYGNANPTPANDAAGVWSEYLAVWHLSEDPAAGGAGDIRDSTSAHHDGTAEQSMNANDRVAGKINTAFDLDGNNDFIDIPSTIDVGNAFTLSAWVDMSTTVGIHTVFSNSLSGLDKDGFRLFVNSDLTADHKLLFETSNGTTPSIAVTDIGAVTPDTFVHIAAVVDRTAGTAQLFVDGVDKTSFPTIRTDFKTANDAELGRMGDLYEWSGLLDEIELAGVKRPAAWIATTFVNQSDPMAFYTVGDEETK